MGMTFVASAGASAAGSGATLDATAALNVAAGDILVAFCGFSGTDTTVKIEATSGNANTLTDTTHGNATDQNASMGYKLVADANGTATFRLTLGANRSWRYLRVWQFRPDSGETVTLAAGPAWGVATSTAIQSGNVSATGDDLLGFGGASIWDYAMSSQQIADTSYDGLDYVNQLGGSWYKLFTTDQTDIHVQATLSPSAAWAAGIFIIKSAAGAGGSSILRQMLAHSE